MYSDSSLHFVSLRMTEKMIYIMELQEMEYRIRPYYKNELAQAYAPHICQGAALNRLATWIKTNKQLSEALRQTEYRSTQHMFTSRQVALIFEYLGEP